ncbi:hypothetical protein D9756_004841 [Leucocoprinus leucothites]|uniref:U6 snRNA phosphodiesterase 1 n=1 Tax=Leucocoprinus leucothites TaxID=201217 RepID=A0A8H5LKB2_9AGAR|nr:hypothetical protein D9756_004841 [Leucoagaricus leucothites]
MNWTLMVNQNYALSQSLSQFQPHSKSGSIGPGQLDARFVVRVTISPLPISPFLYLPTRMKRCAHSIVDYDSSDEEVTQKDVPPPKKKKLPALSTALVVPVPVDNPVLHQGRTRTVPHVDGNWAAHVFVSINVTRSHAMCSLLEATIAQAQRSVPAIQSLISGGETDKNSIELHISLSRPIFIRAHQKEELRRAVRKLSQHPPFKLSFTSFTELQNDEGTRAFLTAEVGAGHHELQKLCSELAPLLRNLRQPAYYSTPRFHASIAWVLLDRVRKPSEAEGKPTTAASLSPPISPSDANPENTTQAELQTPAEFAMVPGIPKELIHKLNIAFGNRLPSPSIGCFDAENIYLKIGKDIVSWPFIGV